MPKIQKTQDNSKYDRINRIYEKLSNTTVGLTTSELATQLNVSTKTIQRDLYEVLVEFGAVKDGRVWKINPKQANDNLGANERIVLGILDEMAKNAGKVFYGKAHSLLAQVSQQLEHPIFTNINSEMLENENIELFDTLEKAIKSKREIKFDYQNYNFQVKPLKLVFFDGFWYLLAFDTNQKDTFKKFHFKTIQRVSILNDYFEIPTIVEERLKHANSIWFNLNEPFTVRLFIDKDARKYFERKPLPSQMIIGEDKDGSVEIEIKITHEMEIKPLIFWYIPHIKILEPQWLNDLIKKDILNYSKEIE